MTPRPTTTILLTGFLGAGKTTLLGRLLKHSTFAGKKLAVLVNDFGSLPVDGALLPEGDYHMSEINRGSIFCVCVKTDLLKDLEKIARDVAPDVLLIEATGAAEPTDVESLLETDFLRDSYRKGPVLCVIDAVNFSKLVDALPALSAQVQLADLVVINKTDLADEAMTAMVAERARAINSTAKIVKAVNCEIPWEELDLLTETSARETINQPGTGGFKTAAPKDTVKYELRSDVIPDRKTFYDFLDQFRTIILRGKGVVDFGADRMFVEVVNGVVSSRHAGDLDVGSPKKTAMSFILLKNAQAIAFEERCREFIHR